ncbi:MAG: TetR/AcrR family transcriptional regulator [Blastocatellia bacterium]
MAIGIFSRKGFRGATTREIARAAGVTEALVFQHFAGKEDLYAAILEFKAKEVDGEEFLEELRLHAERRDDEALFRSLAARTLKYYRENVDFLRLMLYSALEDHAMSREFRARRMEGMDKFLCDYIRRRQREGAFRRRSPQAAVHAYLSQLNYHALLTMLFGADSLRISDEQAVEQFTGLFLDGMRSVASNGHGAAERAGSKKRK